MTPRDMTTGEAEAWDGRPENPERYGSHALRFKDNKPVDALWLVIPQLWLMPDTHTRKPAEIATAEWRYLGPCAPPGAAQDAWREGWRAAREAAAARLDSLARECAADGFRADAEAAAQARDAIRAMEPPR